MKFLVGIFAGIIGKDALLLSEIKHSNGPCKAGPYRGCVYHHKPKDKSQKRKDAEPRDRDTQILGDII